MTLKDKLVLLLRELEEEVIKEGTSPSYAKRQVLDILDECIEEFYKE